MEKIVSLYFVLAVSYGQASDLNHLPDQDDRVVAAQEFYADIVHWFVNFGENNSSDSCQNGRGMFVDTHEYMQAAFGGPIMVLGDYHTNERACSSPTISRKGITELLSQCVVSFGANSNFFENKLVCLNAPEFTDNIPLLMVLYWYAVNEDIQTLRKIVDYSHDLLMHRYKAETKNKFLTDTCTSVSCLVVEGGTSKFVVDNKILLYLISEHVEDEDFDGLKSLISQIISTKHIG